MYVQARALFESMGLQVEWIADKEVVRVGAPDATLWLEMVPGAKKMMVLKARRLRGYTEPERQVRSLAASVVMRGAIMYVPLRKWVDSLTQAWVTSALVAEYEGKRWLALTSGPGAPFLMLRAVGQGAGAETWHAMRTFASAGSMFRSLGVETAVRSEQGPRVVARLGADGREVIRLTEGERQVRVRGRLVALDKAPELNPDALGIRGQYDPLAVWPFAFAKTMGATVRWEAWIHSQWSTGKWAEWFIQVRSGRAVPIATRTGEGVTAAHDLQFDLGAIRNENYGAPGEELRTADGAVLPTPRLPSQYHVGFWLHLRVRNSANRPCKITRLSFEGRPMDEVLTTESQKGPVLWYRLGQNELPPGNSTWLNIRLRNEPRKDVLIGLDTAQAGAVTARVMAPAADR